MGTRKGSKLSVEHRISISCGLLRTNKERKGPDNPAWKGDSVQEMAGRRRAQRLFPETGPCTRCSAPDSERHHVDGNTLNNDPSNIEFLCRKCHMELDGRLVRFREQGRKNVKKMTEAAAREKRARTHCKRGHPLSGDNLYLNNGRRTCRECLRASQAAYRQRKADQCK